MRKVVNELLNLIFPEECLGCERPGSYLCKKCRVELSDASTHEDSPKIMAAVSYDSPLIKKVIYALKYNKAKRAAKPLAELIYERVFIKKDLIPNSSQVIIPTPLFKKCLRKRGFNQAELIAGHLSDITKIDLLTNVLYKNRLTVSQVDMKEREKRLKNLKGAFSVKNPETIKNKIVFVIDDVSTTGATINEARRALLKAGAKEATGIVVTK